MPSALALGISLLIRRDKPFSSNLRNGLLGGPSECFPQPLPGGNRNYGIALQYNIIDRLGQPQYSFKICRGQSGQSGAQTGIVNMLTKHFARVFA